MDDIKKEEDNRKSDKNKSGYVIIKKKNFLSLNINRYKQFS